MRVKIIRRQVKTRVPASPVGGDAPARQFKPVAEL